MFIDTLIGSAHKLYLCNDLVIVMCYTTHNNPIHGTLKIVFTIFVKLHLAGLTFQS